MTKVAIVGYRKAADKNNKSLYIVHAVASEEVKDFHGTPTFQAFITQDCLDRKGVDADALIGMEGRYYNIKEGNRWRTVLALGKE